MNGDGGEESSGLRAQRRCDSAGRADAIVLLLPILPSGNGCWKVQQQTKRWMQGGSGNSTAKSAKSALL